MKQVGLMVVLLGAGLAFAGEPDVASLYEVSTEGTSAQVKAGEKGAFVISIKTKAGAHVSDEAPLKIELSSKDAKLEKQKLTSADSTAKAPAPGTFVDPRFEVGFTPPAAGKTTVDAKMTFFICTEKLCARQTKNLSVTVDVL